MAPAYLPWLWTCCWSSWRPCAQWPESPGTSTAGHQRWTSEKNAAFWWANHEKIMGRSWEIHGKILYQWSFMFGKLIELLLGDFQRLMTPEGSTGRGRYETRLPAITQRCTIFDPHRGGLKLATSRPTSSSHCVPFPPKSGWSDGPPPTWQRWII